MDIHMVEASKNFIKLPDNRWESGWCCLDEVRAKELVGGEIFFHKKQLEPSFFGGTITGYRSERDEKSQERTVFTFQYNAASRNVRTDKGGWSKKMKIISHE